MAEILTVNLAIEDGTEPGTKTIAYTYEIEPSRADCEGNITYRMEAELIGVDIIWDDRLASGMDKHDIEFSDPGPCDKKTVERSFQVESWRLDEDAFGKDEIQLKLTGKSDSGGDASGTARVEAKSNIVVGDFG